MSSGVLCRRDFIGRRFLAVRGSQVNGEAWDIKRGVIRASSHADLSSLAEAKVLVEFDDAVDWRCRQWVALHRQFDVFLIEDTLVGLPNLSSPGDCQPALTFTALVDKIQYSGHLHLVENLTPDRSLNYVTDQNIRRLKEEDIFRLCDSTATSACSVYVRNWLNFQQNQQLLLSCPSRAVNHSIRVYNIDNVSQWYSGRIVGCNGNTKSVTVMDANGVEHLENAALVHMELDSKDLSCILSDNRITDGSKARGRISSQEHPVVKQPKLDVAQDTYNPCFGSPAGVQRPSRSAAETVSTGSRNLFQAMMAVEPSQPEYQVSSTPLVLALSSDSVPAGCSNTLVQQVANTTVSASALLAAAAKSVTAPDPTKIKTLFSYRPCPPQSLMIVFPAPGSTTSSGRTPSASALSAVSPHYSRGNVMMEPSASQRNFGRINESETIRQPNVGLQVVPRVEYIGSFAVLNPGSRQNQPTPNVIPTALGEQRLNVGSPNKALKRNDTAAVGAQQAAIRLCRNEDLQSPVQKHAVNIVSRNPQILFEAALGDSQKTSESRQVLSPVRIHGFSNVGGSLRVRGPVGMQLSPRASEPQLIPGVRSGTQKTVIQTGVQPGMLTGVQPGMLTGVQPGMLTGGQQGIQKMGIQTGVQPGLQTGIQPGIQTGVQQGIQTGVQPALQTGLQQGIQKTGIQQTGVQPGIQTGVQPGLQTGLQPGIQKTGIQQTGVQPGIQKSGMQPGILTGVQPGTQKTGIQTGLQPRIQVGVQSGTQNTGMQTGVHPGMLTGVQPGKLTGMQPGMATGVQPGTQKAGIQTGVQPGMLTGVQLGMLTGVQPGLQKTSVQPGMQADTQTGVQPGIEKSEIEKSQMEMLTGVMKPYPEPLEGTKGPVQNQVSQAQISHGVQEERNVYAGQSLNIRGTRVMNQPRTQMPQHQALHNSPRFHSGSPAVKQNGPNMASRQQMHNLLMNPSTRVQTMPAARINSFQEGGRPCVTGTATSVQSVRRFPSPALSQSSVKTGRTENNSADSIQLKHLGEYRMQLLTAGQKSGKSSQEIVQEVVVNALRKFGITPYDMQCKARPKSTTLNSVGSQTGIQEVQNCGPSFRNALPGNTTGSASNQALQEEKQARQGVCHSVKGRTVELVDQSAKQNLSGVTEVQFAESVCVGVQSTQPNSLASVSSPNWSAGNVQGGKSPAIAASSRQDDLLSGLSRKNSLSNSDPYRIAPVAQDLYSQHSTFPNQDSATEGAAKCRTVTRSENAPSLTGSSVSTAAGMQVQLSTMCDGPKQARYSNSRSYFFEAKSDPQALQVDIINNKGEMVSSNGVPCKPFAKQSISSASGNLPSDPKQLVTAKCFRTHASLEAVQESLKNKPGSRVRSTNECSKGSGKRRTTSADVAPSAKRVQRKWFEEYEDELLDLTQVLDMMKRLDNAKFCQVKESSASQTNKVQKSHLLSDKTNKLAAPRHNTIVSKQKSDCEAKIKFLQQQIIALGLKFENPSAALSKKKLNSFHTSSNGLRTYIQDKSCLMLSTILLKCRECKSACSSSSKFSQVLCRFHAFRRLTRTAKGVFVSSGFSTPTDADAVDISLWMPMLPIIDPQIDVEMAKYIVKNVGNRFCELVEQEKEAMSWVVSNNDVAWKRAVNGVREMCDICSTTLFNIHWVCRKCGYVVCLDCYRTVMHKCTRCHDSVNCAICDRGNLKWAKCSVNRQPHDPKEMMLTQIIPSDVLWVVGRLIHDVRKRWRILENCPCGEDRLFDLADESGSLEQVNCITQSDEKVPPLSDADKTQGNGSSAKLADSDMREGQKSEQLKSDLGGIFGSAPELQPVGESSNNGVNAKALKSGAKAGKSQGPSTLREFLLDRKFEVNGATVGKVPATNCKSFDDIFRRVMKEKMPHVVSKVPSLKPLTDVPSTMLDNITSGSPDSSTDVPHVWLDNGRLLQLPEPRHPGNLKKFQEVWQKGKPVMISNCEQYITKELWLPEVFAEEFGDMENDLVDCSHKVILVGHKMRQFWQGFEKVSARLRDSQGEPMILKLKDWPPMEDFSELLPSRFKDLLQGLPLPEYTHRSGVFNLASRLPEFFVRPDLGPKMYNAYGSALHPLVGSTNLHLDVSDAVNLILYVGIPTDDTEDHEAAAIEAMKKAGCCELTIARTTEKGHKPGALWHIFDAKDSDKIRDLLTKVGLEIGEPVEPHHDPIHDQSWYLDEALRERLLREYSVQGYTLVQCVGDAVFIPAGAPHQVRNLHSCIKAAEDFVSPENLSHCFRMTQEFRHLSDTHSNHEDKLQVKNIIYHAVKDAIAVLQSQEPDTT